MSIRDWFRGLFAGPSHVDTDGRADIDRMAEGRTMNEPYAAMEAADAAQAELDAADAEHDDAE